jgi:hypothetical protein
MKLMRALGDAKALWKLYFGVQQVKSGNQDVILHRLGSECEQNRRLRSRANASPAIQISVRLWFHCGLHLHVIRFVIQVPNLTFTSLGAQDGTIKLRSRLLS